MFGPSNDSDDDIATMDFTEDGERDSNNHKNKESGNQGEDKMKGNKLYDSIVWGP